MEVMAGEEKVPKRHPLTCGGVELGGSCPVRWWLALGLNPLECGGKEGERAGREHWPEHTGPAHVLSQGWAGPSPEAAAGVSPAQKVSANPSLLCWHHQETKPRAEAVQWGFVLRGGEYPGRSLLVGYPSGLCWIRSRVGLAAKPLLKLSTPTVSICPVPLMMPFSPFKSGRICFKSFLAQPVKIPSVHKFTPSPAGTCKKLGEGRRTDALTPLF